MNSVEHCTLTYLADRVRWSETVCPVFTNINVCRGSHMHVSATVNMRSPCHLLWNWKEDISEVSYRKLMCTAVIVRRRCSECQRSSIHRWGTIPSSFEHWVFHSLRNSRQNSWINQNSSRSLVMKKYEKWVAYYFDNLLITNCQESQFRRM